MWSQPSSIAWTVTSKAAFYHFLSYTEHSDLWLDVLYIFEINLVFLMRYTNLFDFWFDKRQWQIGIKLGTEQIIYQKLANFMYKKDIHVNRIESVIFGT